MDKPWKVIVAFVGVFVAGAIFGAFFALGAGREIAHSIQPAAALTTTNTPAVSGPMATKAPAKVGPKAAMKAELQQPLPSVQQARTLQRFLANRLDLTPVQRERITPVVNRAVEDFWRAQANVVRENTFLFQRLRHDIALQLTPDQQQRLDDMWQKWLEARRRQEEAQKQAQALAKAQAAPPAAGSAKAANDAAAKAPVETKVTPPPGDEKKED
jgi:hypothetical protein